MARTSTVLYKYYSPSEYSFDSLSKKYFWMASNKTLNDPYDLIAGWQFKEGYIFSKLKDAFEKIYPSFHEANEESIGMKDTFHTMTTQLKQFGSTSFCRVPAERLLWAHYAGQFSGFCMEFEFSNDDAQSEYIPHEVLYLDKFPVLISANDNAIGNDVENVSCPYNGGNLLNINLCKYIRQWLSEHKSINNLRELYIKLACVKSQEWVYEQEERIVSTINVDVNGGELPWDKCGVIPRRIIFGHKFEHDKNAQYIIQGLKNSGIKQSQLYEIRANALTHFELNVVPMPKKTIDQFYSQL